MLVLVNLKLCTFSLSSNSKFFLFFLHLHVFSIGRVAKTYGPENSLFSYYESSGPIPLYTLNVVVLFS